MSEWETVSKSTNDEWETISSDWETVSPSSQQQAPVTLQEQSGVQPTPLDYALNPSTLNTVVATIKLVPLLIKDLDEAERAIAKEIIQNDRVRGSAEKAMFEDLEDF